MKTLILKNEQLFDFVEQEKEDDEMGVQSVSEVICWCLQ